MPARSAPGRSPPGATGGSVPAATAPATNLEPRRSAPARARRTANTTGGTGNVAAGACSRRASRGSASSACARPGRGARRRSGGRSSPSPPLRPGPGRGSYQAAHRLAEPIEGHGHHERLRLEEIRGPWPEVVRAARHRRAQAPPGAVANDGRADSTAHRVGDPRRQRRVAAGRAHRYPAHPAAWGAGESLEGRTVADAPDQAASRFRPRDRRDRRTARPPRVRIRTRKPCVFLRLRVFGWYVRFTRRASWTGASRGSRADGPRGRRGARVYRRWPFATNHLTGSGCPRSDGCCLSAMWAGARFPRLAGLRPAVANFPGELRLHPADNGGDTGHSPARPR